VRAFLVAEIDGEVSCEVRDVEPHRTDPSDVLVAVEYSSINYKDAMVASASSRVRRVASLVGGVDAAGTVVESDDEHYRRGDRVAVHGGDLGVGRDGGFATEVYAPPRYLSRLPDTISSREAMVVGTAGFTAMASVLALEDRGIGSGENVLVTGATGGVGSQAITYLALRGHHPVASTGSLEQTPWLLDRGAVRVIGRDEVSDRAGRVLGSELWDGAIDSVGGATLAEVLRCLRYGASVAASGLVRGAELKTTVYPFITRAIGLIGVDAVDASTVTRERVWTTLGTLAPQVDFEAFVDHVVTLDGLGVAIEEVRAGNARGRVLVDTRR
jgi:acrylyl-CoA reductase (NADPH)